MIIKTFDPVTMKEKETISQVISVIYNKRFYKVGSFEIHTTSDKFEENDIIAFMSEGKMHSGIVMKIFESTEKKIVSGYDLKGMYCFRYITAPTEYEGTPDAILKDIVTEYFTTGDRAIPKFSIMPSVIDGENTVFLPENGYVEKAIESFGVIHEIGTDICFDVSGKLEFTTLKGMDKSKYIKFGRKFHNIEKTEYTKDLFNTYNVGYSLDEEGNEFVIGEQKGLLRRECYKEKNISEYLSEKAATETLRAEANEKYKYGVDYDLGDYVTVIHQNKETVKQITEVKEVYEKNKRIIVPVFGVEKENPIKKILRGE